MTQLEAIVVRPCQLADVAVLTAVEPPGARLAEVFFERQQAGGVVYLVGWLEGMPVGTGVVVTGERPELKNLQVRKEFRGRGVGRAIVAEAEDEVRESGLLVLGVGLDNPAARRLYERLGYRPTGRISTCTYRFVDETGIERETTETSEDLQKVLTPVG